jgi:hypothetical protein
MRSVYLATVAIVTIFVTVFSVINMSGEALFTRASTESLVSLPSHFRWGYGGYVTVAQYYGARNQAGNLSGIARSELRSQSLASTNIPGVGIVDVFAAPNGSLVYSGLSYVSGAKTPGPGQVIVIGNSQNSSLLNIGQVIRTNFTFYAGSTGGSNKYVSMARNLTIVGFADATVNGFGYLTNSETGSTTGNLFTLPALVANWDDLVPPLIDFVNSDQATTFITELFVYVKQSDFIGLDAGAALAKVQSLQGQIQSITSSIGGTTDSWLIDRLQQQQSQANFYTSIAIVTSAPALISCFPITEYLTTASIKRAQYRNSISSSKTEDAIDPTFKHRFYWRISAAASAGIIVGIAVSIPTVALLVYSSATRWTPSLETLAYSAVYGIALATVIWLQSRVTINKQRRVETSIQC